MAPRGSMWTLCQVSSAAEPKTIGEYLLRCRFYDACFHVMENRRLSQTTPRMAPAPIEIPLNSVGRIDVPWETFVNLRIKARKPPCGDFRVWICLKSFGKEVCADRAGCAVHFRATDYPPLDSSHNTGCRLGVRQNCSRQAARVRVSLREAW